MRGSTPFCVFRKVKVTLEIEMLIGSLHCCRNEAPKVPPGPLIGLRPSLGRTLSPPEPPGAIWSQDDQPHVLHTVEGEGKCTIPQMCYLKAIREGLACTHQPSRSVSKTGMIPQKRIRDTPFKGIADGGDSIPLVPMGVGPGCLDGTENTIQKVASGVLGQV